MIKSLKTKATIFLTISILFIGSIITLYFIYSSKKSIENALISKGMTVSKTISFLSEKGLAEENLDIIGIASSVVKDEEIINIEFFNNLWDRIAKYSRDNIEEEISPLAIEHFKESRDPFFIKTHNMYDFYNPIEFTPSPRLKPIVIGYIKVCMTSEPLNKRLSDTIKKNILIGSFLTVLTILLINISIDRIILKPISALNKKIKLFKEGLILDNIVVHPKDEIGELAKEFESMAKTIKEKTEGLIESEKKIRNFFERTEHALFRLDRDCNIIETNRRFDELFGVVKRLCDLLDEKEMRRCVDIVNKEDLVHSEENVIDKNGNKLTIMLSLYAERDSMNNISGYDGYIIDITERKRFQEQLIQSQKMETVGLLAGGIAHDFNNLLQGILGYASLLKMNLSEKDPDYKPINIIEESAIKASDLVKQLLGFARGGKYVTQIVNINKAVENVFNIINRTFDKKIIIKLDLSDNLLYVKADQSQIEQVILNMCINAKDAMPDGGELTIKTLNYEYKKEELSPLSPFNAKEGKYVALAIKDTGIGIPKEFLNRIFEPFFTTKQMGKGTGMGLAMAYGIIKNHNGFITVDSEVNKGSTFTIYLPTINPDTKKEGVIDKKEIIHSVPSTASNEALRPKVGASLSQRDFSPFETPKDISFFESLRDEAPQSKGKVLLVDDEKIVRDVGSELLKKLGYEVLEANNGIEAIEIFKKRKKEINFVILDIIMPKMSGKETFNRLKEIEPEVKVFVSSGYTINSVAREIIQSGAKGFIQKPYNLSVLSKALELNG
jgi:two-component system cell cycle sensor histidine kinase/response regulator CckA